MTGRVPGPVVVRAVPVVDQLDRDGERLVLLEGRAVRLAGLAPVLLDLLAQPRDLETLGADLEAVFGTPAEGTAADLARRAVEALAAEGLVEMADTSDVEGE